MHVKDDVDRMLFAVARYLRLDLNEGIAAVAEGVGDNRDRMLELLRVVPISGLHGE